MFGATLFGFILLSAAMVLPGCAGVNLSAADVEGQTAPPPRKGGRLRWRSINFLLPAILLSSDAVFGLAAGMTVK